MKNNRITGITFYLKKEPTHNKRGSGGGGGENLIRGEEAKHI